MRIGLTGGIGSGKSTFGQLLASLGAALIDSDQIARSVTGPGGAAIEAIRQNFGVGYVDASGALDRARMRALAFSDEDARARLESIVHPLVTQRSAYEAHQAQQEGKRLIVHDIPLLVESGRWTRQLDAVVVIDCPPETQVERVVQRSGLAREAVQAILANQASRPVRRAAADAVVHNGPLCTLTQLQVQAVQLGRRFGL
ncbi:dephospho-CoA kinase [Acidovorax sp. CF316]|uniref:dephospho-CoA kinase n=1 Tax=Acidovorax sp. CF316 TaxID=1144317 RepID=UPI00026BCB3D|nr:dephospho-CoA kinase [Acidovorax sp. CF316]EJE52650.1 dephospho-CoA kinase [Acidovorax sp. CF316]